VLALVLEEHVEHHVGHPISILVRIAGLETVRVDADLIRYPVAIQVRAVPVLVGYPVAVTVPVGYPVSV
jgi:hypothetical protein